MNDLTILYYTANRISDYFAQAIIGRLLLASDGSPIVSVSHNPMSLGKNICVGSLKPSTYNIYRQVFIGAMLVETPYLACCEDDSIYTAEHFAYRPPVNTFAYNINRWNVDSDKYFYRRRSGLCMCIAPTALMVQALSYRFAMFPSFKEDVELCHFGEPGRYESRLGLPGVKMETFQTKVPTLTFNHRPSTGGKRKILRGDILKDELPDYGKASDLWRLVHG